MATPRDRATQYRSRIEQLVWETDLRALPRWQGSAAYLLRVLFATAREFTAGLPPLRAMALAFTTLLSIVPLLAFSFSVLKGFGAHNHLEPMLLGFLQPLGADGVKIALLVVDFVDRIKVGVLGALGLALVVFTVVSLLKKIEMAFNFTWRVSEQRGLSQRISNYVGVALIGPLFAFLAVGITASLGNLEFVNYLGSLPGAGTALTVLGRLASYSLIIAAFAFIYTVVPNTRVQLRSAVTGAVVAGVLWQTLAWSFASLIKYWTSLTLVYSGFGSIFLAMVWLYLNWLILLAGATIAFYHQHPECQRFRPGASTQSSRLREKLALLAMLRIGQSFAGTAAGGWTAERLAREHGVPVDAVSFVLGALERAGLVVRTDNDATGWLPARALDTIRLARVWEAVHDAGDRRAGNALNFAAGSPVEQWSEYARAAVTHSFGDATVQDLVVQAASADAGDADEAVTPVAARS